MVINPDIIPPSSNEGNNASKVSPKWRLIALGSTLLLMFVFILKAIIPLILMIIGIYFIYKQYKEITSK